MALRRPIDHTGMSGKPGVTVTDHVSGEEYPAVVWKRAKWRGPDFIMLFQESLKDLGRLDLKGETRKVLFYVLGAVDWDSKGWLPLVHADISRELKIARPNVSKAIAELLDQGVLLEGPPSADRRMKTYQLNPKIGKKGKLKTA